MLCVLTQDKVGDDHPSRDYSSDIRPEILATDRRHPTRGIYHYIFGSLRPRKHVSREGLRLYRVLYVFCEVHRSCLDDILHVHHDIGRNTSNKRPNRVPILEEPWGF